MRTITHNTYTFPGSYYNTDSLIHLQSISAFDEDQAYLWGKLGGAAESSVYYHGSWHMYGHDISLRCREKYVFSILLEIVDKDD